MAVEKESPLARLPSPSPSLPPQQQQQQDPLEHRDGQRRVPAALGRGAGDHQAGARRRLGRGRAEFEEVGRASDHPQRAFHGVVAAPRAPSQERLRFRHRQQANVSDLLLWAVQRVASVHRRFADQAVRVHDPGLQWKIGFPQMEKF